MANKKKSPSEPTETDIKVKIVPRSSMNRIVGREGDLFKIKVTAPPIEGQANKALTELLSKKLKKPKSYIQITSGESSRLKTVRIKNCSLKEIETLLSQELG